jgi:hypothetical protein
MWTPDKTSKIVFAEIFTVLGCDFSLFDTLASPDSMLYYTAASQIALLYHRMATQVYDIFLKSLRCIIQW